MFQHVYIVLINAPVLIVYDYITTLDREISLYWLRRIDGSTILFALNRYFYMVLDVYTIFVAFLVTDEVCAIYMAHEKFIFPLLTYDRGRSVLLHSDILNTVLTGSPAVKDSHRRRGGSGWSHTWCGQVSTRRRCVFWS